MSETIQTTFKADSDAFTAEVKKAQSSLDQLSGKTLPYMEQNMNSAFYAAQKTAKGMAQLQGASKNTGAGLLQLAYVADDAQYGLKGILNNVPGLVQGLGMGAGVAGVISLVALAANYAVPALIRFYSSADSEAAKKAALEYGKAIQQTTADLAKANAIKKTSLDLARQEQEYANAVQKNIGFGNAADDLAQKITRLKEQQALEDQIAEAKTKAQLAEAKSAGRDTAPIENAAAEDAATLTRIRLDEEIKLQRQIQVIADDRSARIREQAKADAEAQTQYIAEAQAEIERLQRNSATTRNNLQLEQKLAEDPDASKAEKRLAEQNIKSIKERLAKEEISLANLEAGLATAQKNADIAKQQYQAAAQAAEEQSTAATLQAQALERQKSAAAEIAAQAEKERAANQASEKAEKAKAAAEKEAAKAKKEAAKAEQEAKEASRKEKEQKNRENEYRMIQAEILALRQQSIGRKDIAAAIRKNIEMAKEAKSIAAATGIQEKDALELVKQKNELLQKIAKNNRMNDGRIRLFRPGESPNSLQRGAAGTVLRSEEFTRRTQAWMGSPLRTRSTADQTQEDQLKVQKQLLDIWSKNLGLI